MCPRRTTTTPGAHWEWPTQQRPWLRAPSTQSSSTSPAPTNFATTTTAPHHRPPSNSRTRQGSPNFTLRTRMCLSSCNYMANTRSSRDSLRSGAETETFGHTSGHATAPRQAMTMPRRYGKSHHFRSCVPPRCSAPPWGGGPRGSRRRLAR